MQWFPFLAWYPAYGILLLVAAVLLGIWLVLHVEKSPQLSWPKLALDIFLIALSSGLGVHLILLGLGA
jgi:uncharacterized membrane protein